MRFSAKPVLTALLGALLLAGCTHRPETAAPALSPEPSPAPAVSSAPSPPAPAPFRALDREFDGQETELDLSAVGPERLEEVLSLLPRLPRLARVETVPAEGESPWKLEELARLREALPEEAELGCRFELFGKTVSSADEEITYYRENIGDGQLPTLRRALPLLSGCRRLLLDDCKLSYARLAELREEFPERGLVWRVRFGVDSALTDADTIWSTSVLDENCDVLKYCTEVVNLDIGENHSLSDFHYLNYMHKLRVLILSHTEFQDCSFVADCPELEFLEIDHCKVSDLSPLPQCKNLKHLSIENDLLVTDITPVFQMTWLERMRVSILPKVPKEQKAELEERIPDSCLLITDRNRYLWRQDAMGNLVPRYALLRQQFGYNGYYVPTDALDWADIRALGYTWESVFTAS